MLHHLLLASVLFQAAIPPPITPAPGNGNASQPPSGTTREMTEDSTVLLRVRRIYVDSFGDDVISRELQSMLVSSLVASKRFKVTENRDRADAVLKGVALEKTSQELHAYGEGTSVGAAGGGYNSEIIGSGGNISGSSSGGFVARHLGTNDSSVNTETVSEARIAVRLVTPDGDVFWTTTQESKGAKYKSASADVADMCVKQLLRDVAKIETGSQSTSITGEQKEAQTKKQ